MIVQFSYVKATSVTDAVKHLSEPKAVLHAGGTDLLGCLRDNVIEAEKVVSISGLDELKGISKGSNGTVRIGALTTIDEIANSELIAERYTVLSQAAREIASPQLRNQGTIGGNLCQRPRCWYYRGDFHCARKGGDVCYAEEGENQYHCIFGGDPCYIVFPSDCAPALAAFDARLVVPGLETVKAAAPPVKKPPLMRRKPAPPKPVPPKKAPNGRIPIEEFYLLPSEDLERENILRPNQFFTEVVLPPVIKQMKSSYRKVRARQVWDFALVSTAILLMLEGDKVLDARIFLGGVAPIPWRAWAAEKALIGNILSEANINAAAEAAVKKAQPLSENAYKVDLVKGTLKEELAKLA